MHYISQVYLWAIWVAFTRQASAWISYPPDGYATLTHYDIPRDFVAACGCMPSSTHYPTAALSQMAYGSSRAYGPACGRCFNLTLLNSATTNPPFYPNTTKFIIIKVTDLCPLSKDGWCSGTENKPNIAGHYLNFDLAYPSEAIPTDFFPSDETLYGYKDFGVWNISYETVSCNQNWAGSQDTDALGTVIALGPESVCCPANPLVTSDFCVSYSDTNGLPPDLIPNNGTSSHKPVGYILFIFTVLIYIYMIIH